MRTLFKFSLLTFCIALGALIVLLSASIYTYHALTDEAVIAELRFDRTGPREYVAYLRTGNRCEERKFPILGDQWRIDAEFLKWKYWALLFGLDSQYRLDRIEGRYRMVQEQNSQPNVAHDLADGTAVDIVEFAGVARPSEFPDRCNLRQLNVPRHRPAAGLLRVENADRHHHAVRCASCSTAGCRGARDRDRARLRRAAGLVAARRAVDRRQGVDRYRRSARLQIDELHVRCGKRSTEKPLTEAREPRRAVRREQP